MRKIFVNLTFLLLLLILPTVARAALTYNVDPTDGTTGVSVNIATVSITFNEAMQLSSFTDRVSGIPIDSITASADKKTLYFHLSSTLSYSTTYTVTINKKVKNDNNVKIGDLGYSSGISWSFTTMAKPLTDTTPPTVASTFPTAGATGVAVSAVVRATFSEVMNQATLTTSTFTVSAGGSPITGAVTMDPTNKIAYFTPSVNLSSNTVYTATITTGVRDAAGNAMTVAYSWNFTTVSTDATPPTIVSVSPLSGGTSVPVSTLVSATFSEAMDAATITSASFTLKAGATSISGSVAYDNGIFAATFTPLSALANSTTYTATITTTAKDLAGNALTSTYTWTFTTVAATAVPPASDYCQIPPYVTSGSSSLKPNVLILLDNSGSMAEFAYKTEGKGSSNKNYDDSYNPDASYYGYFDSTKMYSYYTTSGGYFRVDPALAPDKTSFWSGNFLNWLTMRRVDIIRKVLVGGKTSPRSANVANYLIPLEDPDRDFYKTYNNVKYMVYGGTSKEQIVNQNTGTSYTLQVYVGDQLPQEGIILTMADKIRFGIEIFNDAGQKFETGGNGTADGGNIIVDIGSTGTNLITQIESADPSTWTPLAESFYEATRYFQATTGAFTNANYAAKDPIQFKCQKNFILILTDGESTMDRNLPGGNWQSSSNANPIADNVTSPNNFNVETWMDSIATQENITSQWATDANPSGGTYYLEGVAYWAHNTDMRSSVRGKNDIPGSQNITTYAVFAFDDSAVGRDLLKKAAKYGGFNDYDHTGKPDNAAKWDRDGNGVPDTYYEAQNGAQLAGELLKALNDILARVSAGTAASILSNSEGSGANILQAVFYPKKFFDAQTSADWIGEMHNMWYYIDPFINNSSIREDSDYPNPNTKHELNLGTDKVVNFYFNTAQSRTLVQRSTDSLGDGQPDIDTNGDGVKDTYTFVDEVDPDYVKSIWKAGKQLWSRTSSRTLYTQLNGTLTNFATLDTTLASTQSFLQAANKTEADKIIAFTLGTMPEQSGYRSRKVTIGGTTGVWKLGDIVSSTPKLQSSIRLNAYNVPSPVGYGDTTYGNDNAKTGYIYTSGYKNRGMVYVGANDGMLHAFKLGTLDVTAAQDRKASLKGSGLGEEEWAFIPKNVLPYLRYSTEMNYEHLYYVDGTTTINDVSIGVPSGCTGDYWNCVRPADGSSWRTVLVGSMGLGGASKIKGAGCKGTGCVETPVLDPSDNTKGIGYSSYFALDVTNPDSPSLLWEFGDPGLGYSTAGAAFVRIAGREADNVTPDKTKNGKWFAVLASGPTGPIDTTQHQFKGSSNQNLTLYVLDLKTGAVVATIDTLTDGTKLANAFAGSITGGVVDTDRWNKDASGFYQDDAIYIGYTQLSGTTWSSGGVLRLMTGENLDPTDPTKWRLSKVIDGIGPVTTNITRLQDRKNHNLWLYFGSGRYYFNQDDNSNQQKIFGLKEPCYLTSDRLDATCTLKKTLTDLTNQSTTANAVSNSGWYINLDAEDTTNNFGAERLITDPVPMSNGAVFFTTFKPTVDVCSFGGSSYMWATRYDNGLQAPPKALEGKALVQVSTGAFVELDLYKHFDPVLNPPTSANRLGRRIDEPMIGKPPSDPPPIVSKSNLKPVKRVIHIQEH